MKNKIIARYVSFLLGPQILWPLMLIILFAKAGLTLEKDLAFIILTVFLLVVIPLGYILFLFSRKKVHDLDITIRRERLRPLFVIFLCSFMAIIVATFFKETAVLKFLTLTLILLVANSAVTLFWKISLHMAMNTIFVLYVNYLFDNKFLILLFFIPFIFWSRLVLKKHSAAQLVAGFFLNGGIILLSLQLFK